MVNFTNQEMVKNISAVVVSEIVGLLILLLGMMIYSSLFPYPDGINLKDSDSVTLFFDHLPDKALRIKVIINAFAGFCVALLATIIGSHKKVSGVTGLALFLVLVIFREAKYDLSDVFTLANIGSVIIAGSLGILIGLKGFRRA